MGMAKLTHEPADATLDGQRRLGLAAIRQGGLQRTESFGINRIVFHGHLNAMSRWNSGFGGRDSLISFVLSIVVSGARRYRATVHSHSQTVNSSQLTLPL